MAAMIKEVAKRAGVSTATVSRILNGKGSHSSTTVKSVERIIEELGFSSSHYSNTPDCVGIIMLSYQNFMTNDYTVTLLSAIMEALTADGMIAQIIPVTPGRMSFQYIKEIVEVHSLKGLIIQEFDQLYTISAQLNKLDIPVICVGNTVDQSIKHSVCCDNYNAGRDGAAYFWSIGHRRFGVISTRQTDICQKMRLDGFSRFIAQNGGNLDDIWKKEYNGIEDSVSAAVAEIVNLRERPTAILCTNSSIAVKFMVELKRHDIYIPEDLSLISFEERGELEQLETPMTAICQPTRLMGEEAVKILIKLIRHYHAEECQPLNCNLVVRNTTAPVKINP